MSTWLKAFVFFISILSLILSVPTYANSIEFSQEDRKNLKLKHHYKHTFKKPYYFNHTVPFFDTYGHTLLAPDFIRLAPSVPSHTGSIWAQLPNPNKEWEVELSFKITGNFYVGGRGIAFWYTKDRAEEGPVFGNKDKWDGLVIMFETVDHSRKREHPFIMAHLNDGSKIYNNISEPYDAKFAGCYRTFRNTAPPVYARISYYNSTIRLAVDANDGGKVYHTCFEAKNINLPVGYYFGISAAAEGETPDDHDILSFETYEINPVDEENRPLRPHEAEKEKRVPAENYEIPEDVKMRIENIQRVVSPPKEEDDTKSIDFIRGTQIRIIESLKRLHEIVQSGGVNSDDKYYTGETMTESQLTAISHKLDKIIASLSFLESRVSRISASSSEYAIKDLKESIQRIMGRLEAMEGRITGQFQQTQRSLREANKSQESTTSIWLYIIYFIFIIAFAGGSIILYQTKREMDQKKFI